jgi:hypothetical protein
MIPFILVIPAQRDRMMTKGGIGITYIIQVNPIQPGISTGDIADNIFDMLLCLGNSWIYKVTIVIDCPAPAIARFPGEPSPTVSIDIILFQILLGGRGSIENHYPSLALSPNLCPSLKA